MIFVGDFSKESMLELFVFEMKQQLEQLEQLIIQGEEGYSSEDIGEIFRIMHTIKGSAAMMEYNEMSKTAHAVEDLFFYLREEMPSDVDYSSLTDIVLEGMDFIKSELEKIEAGESADVDAAELISKIKNYLAVLKGETPAASAPSSLPSQASASAATPAAAAAAVGDDVPSNRFTAKITFEEGCEMENVRAFTLLHNLKDVIRDAVTEPADVVSEDSAPIIRRSGFTITFTSDHSFDELKKLLGNQLYIASVDLQNCKLTRFSAVIKFEEGCEMENVRAFAIVHNLEAIAKDITHVPENVIDDDSAIESIRKNGFKMEFSIGKSYDEVYNMLTQTVFLSELHLTEIDQGTAETPSHAAAPAPAQPAPAPIQPAAAAPAPVPSVPNPVSAQPKPAPAAAPAAGSADKGKKAAANAPAQKKAAPSQQMISVNIGKLDQLLNLMGELVISEAMTTQNSDLEGLELENFNKSARQLRKIINDVQDTVMSMRMVALSNTFLKMHRIVRDMCKQLNKKVDLVLVGEETEVDKNIIEHISDPLMHIIRNSVDHGIEMPDDRIALGKEEKGTVVLEAKNSGGEVLIIVKDDGAGIDTKKVLAKAKSAGILKKPEEEYTHKEICQFIFHAGLSTNDAVTQYSGRGVGMDVVTANVEAVGGTIVVDSVEGEGTTTVLKIPLTLAIVEGMLVKMGGGKYTIPIASIIETYKGKRENIFFDPDGNEMIQTRGEVYNIVRLHDFFETETEITNIEDGVLIMLENEGQQICLFVDELIGEQQVVVKSMPRYIKRIKGIGGCTLLGNGDISLIVDVAGFFDKD